MYIVQWKFKRKASLYILHLLFFLENMDGFIHDSRSEEITDFIICAILKHGKVVFCFLHLKSHFSLLLVPVYRGLYDYPEQRRMDGTPRSPFQRMVEAKEKVSYVCRIICKHLEIFREPGMDFLNVATHLLWMILVREGTPSYTPKPVHSTLSDSDKVAVLLAMCPSPHPLGRWIHDHE